MGLGLGVGLGLAHLHQPLDLVRYRHLHLVRDPHLTVHQLLIDRHLLIAYDLRGMVCRLVGAVAIVALHRRAVQRPLMVARRSPVRVA